MSVMKIRDIYGYTGTEKHPAHGPLRDERLHQVSEILSKAVAQRDGGSLGHAMADAVKAIGELNAAKLRIAELERDLKATENNLIDANCHRAELEARTVTLPDRKSELFWPGDAFEFDSLGYVIAVENAIRAAGIKTKGDAHKGR